MRSRRASLNRSCSSGLKELRPRVSLKGLVLGRSTIFVAGGAAAAAAFARAAVVKMYGLRLGPQRVELILQSEVEPHSVDRDDDDDFGGMFLPLDLDMAFSPREAG